MYDIVMGTVALCMWFHLVFWYLSAYDRYMRDESPMVEAAHHLCYLFIAARTMVHTTEHCHITSHTCLIYKPLVI